MSNSKWLPAEKFDLLKIALEAKYSTGTAALYCLAHKNTAQYGELLKTLLQKEKFDLLKIALGAQNSNRTFALFFLKEDDYTSFLKKLISAEQIKLVKTTLQIRACDIASTLLYENENRAHPKACVQIMRGILRFKLVAENKGGIAQGLAVNLGRMLSQTYGHLISASDNRFNANCNWSLLPPDEIKAEVSSKLTCNKLNAASF